MAFPASSGIQSAVLRESQALAGDYRRLASEAITMMENGLVSANLVVQLWQRLKSCKARFSEIAATPGIGQYAKDQLGNQGVDISVEFVAMNAAMQGVINWIETNFPQDADGYIQKDTFGPGGMTVRQFTTAQTVGLRASLATFVASIE